MAEPDKQQFGDGQDQFGEAARNFASAAKSLGKESARQAGAVGPAGVANASAAAVQAGVEGGKAVSQIAAGTAAGGPWGAVLSAAWSLRHTLYKLLVCTCLFFLILIVLLASLPTIVTNQVFGLNGADMTNPLTLSQSMTEMTGVVQKALSQAHEQALAQVEAIIAQGGYDQELSLEALDDRGEDSTYDVAYILCAYSVSMEQVGTSEEDLKRKLAAAADDIYKVTYEGKTVEMAVTEEPEEEGEGESSQPPRTQTIAYVACTIHPLDQGAILDAFGLDPSASYGGLSITCGEAVTNMATALKLTLYGSNIGVVGGSTGTRRGNEEVAAIALSQVGQVGTAFPAGWSGAPVLSPGAMPRWGFPSPGSPAAPPAAWPGSSPTANGGTGITRTLPPGTPSSLTGTGPATPTTWASWREWTRAASTPWRAIQATTPAITKAIPWEAQSSGGMD